MNGDQLDGFLVGLQPELVFLGDLVLRLPLLGEPLEQAGDAQTILDAGAVEHFREMQEVGQPALAVGEGQQAGPDLLALHEAAEHLDEAALEPEVQVAAEVLEDLLPLRLLLRHGFNPGTGEADAGLSRARP